eukprot:796175_1
MEFTEIHLATACFLSYILFYLGYDRVKRKFSILSQFKKVFLCQNTKQSFMELNKVLALSGFTVYAYSFINFTGMDSTWLGDIACWMLVVHGAYSGATYIDYWFGAKQTAIPLGVVTWFFIYYMFPG